MKINIVFKDGEVRVYQPDDDWADYRVFKHYFAVINEGGATPIVNLEKESVR